MSKRYNLPLFYLRRVLFIKNSGILIPSFLADSCPDGAAGCGFGVIGVCPGVKVFPGVKVLVPGVNVLVPGVVR